VIRCEWAGALLSLIFLMGCHRAESPVFVASDGPQQLKPELQKAVNAELVKQTGGFLNPKLLIEAGDTHADLQRGQAVYQQRCVQCHGVSGDGAGPSAHYMYPRPRDYRKGIFKFTSTPYGIRPLREDLLRTVRQGIRGTSMPGFALLPEQDQQAVVDYVILLSRRGELKQQLIGLADAEDAVDEEIVKTELIPTVLTRWSEAIAMEVLPITPQPRFTLEHVERGKQAFLTKGCSKCHGIDGRGQTKENRGTDAWGFQTRAADLTSGMLHGGNRPQDIYRRIYSGINGTPMPSFANVLKQEPDTIWDLVAYVLSVSNRRRQGEIPTPGPINPYVAATPTAAAETQ
jgi:mono/diheme cytochrome c family protein